MAVSVNIKQLDGSLQKIAGNTILLDATCAEVRSGSFSTELISADGYATVEVVFSTPMPDANYVAILNPRSGAWIKANYMVSDKTTTGFTALCSNTYAAGGMPTQIVDYYAFRLVELDGYTALQNKVSNPDSTPVENSTNLVTSGGVYDAISSASKIFVNSESAWNELDAETKATYQIAILTDKLNVNAVDSTDGSTTVVANKHLVFKGTLEEWEALSVAERKAYDEALITNDMDTGEVVNGVTDGDMRAVTSNAVYDAITDLTPVDAVTNGNMKAVTSNAVYDAMNDIKFGTCTKPSNISATIYDCRYVQFGKVVIVYIFISFTSSIAASTDYIVGLPKAAANATTQLSMTGSTSSTDSLRAYIEVNGTSIRNQDRAMNTTETYSGQLIYICQ